MLQAIVQHILDIAAAMLKPAWAGLLLVLSHFATMLGNLTAAQLAAYLAIVYTSVQLYVTVRDKLFMGRSGD